MVLLFLIWDFIFNWKSGFIIKHSEEKGIVIADHNYEKVLEVVNRLVLIREGVLMELTDKRGLVEQGYLLDESYL